MDAPTNPATSRVLTLATLREKGTCEEQVAIFRKLFGAQVEITEALCVEHARVFSWEWAAEELLSAPARKAYDEAAALADKAYREAVALADKAYDEAIAPAVKACDEAIAPAWARAYITDREAL